MNPDSPLVEPVVLSPAQGRRLVVGLFALAVMAGLASTQAIAYPSIWFLKWLCSATIPTRITRFQMTGANAASENSS